MKLSSYLCVASTLFILIVFYQVYDIAFVPSTGEHNVIKSVFKSSTQLLFHNRLENEAMSLIKSPSSSFLQNIDEKGFSSLLWNQNLAKSILNKTQLIFGDYSNDFILKSVCITTFRSSESAFKILIDNIENEYIAKFSLCDWVVIVQGGSRDIYDTYINKAKSMIRRSNEERRKKSKESNDIRDVNLIFTRLIRSKDDLAYTYPNVSVTGTDQRRMQSAHNRNNYPKSAIYIELLQHLNFSDYSHVWLLSGNTDISHFNMRKFLKVIRCSFFPELPLVIQPLVKPKYDKHTQEMSDSSSKSKSIMANTSVDNYLLYDSWPDHAGGEEIIAVKSGYVSMDAAPYIRADFFAWFVKSILQPTLPLADVMNSDYMYDNIICSAADAFAGSVNKNLNDKGSGGRLSNNRRKLWLFGSGSSSSSDVDADKKKSKKKKDKKKGGSDVSSVAKIKAAPKVVPVPSISLAACVLAVYGSPVTYKDDESKAGHGWDGASLSEDDAPDLDRRMMKVLRQVFPSWYVDSGLSGLSPTTTNAAAEESESTSWRNPLKNTTAYPRSSRLNSFCLKY